MNVVVKLKKLIVSQIKIKPRFYSIKIEREEKEGHEEKSGAKRVEKREGEMQTGDRRDRHLSLSPWEVGGPGGPGGPAKLTDLVTSLKFWC